MQKRTKTILIGVSIEVALFCGAVIWILHRGGEREEGAVSRGPHAYLPATIPDVTWDKEAYKHGYREGVRLMGGSDTAIVDLNALAQGVGQSLAESEFGNGSISEPLAKANVDLGREVKSVLVSSAESRNNYNRAGRTDPSTLKAKAEIARRIVLVDDLIDKTKRAADLSAGMVQFIVARLQVYGADELQLEFYRALARAQTRSTAEPALVRLFKTERLILEMLDEYWGNWSVPPGTNEARFADQSAQQTYDQLLRQCVAIRAEFQRTVDNATQP